MSTVIGIMGQSGHGKTTAMRNLDPASTFYIHADCKELPWRGWTKTFRQGGNYIATADPSHITARMKSVSDTPHIKTLVIDTINAVMIHEEMTRMREKGYDKWIDIAQFVYEIVDNARKLRNDLIVVLVFHVQNRADGEGVDHILTNGRKLEKVHLEYLLNTLLYAKCRQTDQGNQYYFEVQANQSTAKSPMGLFAGMEIPNDMQAVCSAIREYQGGDESQESGQAENAVKAESGTSAVQREAQQPQRDSPVAGSDIDKLIELMSEAGIPPIIMSRWCSDEKRGWLRDGDLDMSHIPPDKLAKMVGDKWESVKAGCELLVPDPFDAVGSVRTLMEVSGIADDDLTAYCNAKADVLPGMAPAGSCWWESDTAMLAKIAEDAVWDKVAGWCKANRK